MGVLALFGSSTEFSVPPDLNLSRFFGTEFCIGSPLINSGTRNPKYAKTPILHTTVRESKSYIYMIENGFIQYCHVMERS